MVVAPRSSPHRPSRRAAALEPAAPRGCSSQKVRRLSRRLSQHFDRIVAEAGLKTTQYTLLCHVVELGPLQPRDLARAVGIDASTLTRNLQPLAAAGWVAIGKGDDERSRLVTATPAGREKRSEALRVWKRAQLAFNARIGSDVVARLHALVDECMALLDESEPDDT